MMWIDKDYGKWVRGLFLAITLFATYTTVGIICVSTFGSVAGTFIWNLISIGLLIFYLSRRGYEYLNKGLLRLKAQDHILLSTSLFFLWLVAQLVSLYIYTSQGDPAFDNYQANRQMNYTLYLTISLVLAPISEELMFRGVFYGILRKSTGIVFALILQLFVFSFVHGTTVHLVPTILLSLFLTVVLELTGDIKYSMLYHGLFNGFSIFLGALIAVPESWLQPVFLSFIFILGLLIGFVLLFMFYQKNKSQILGLEPEDTTDGT